MAQWALSGEVEAPTIDPETVIAQNRAALDALDLGDDAGTVGDNRRLLALDAQRGAGDPLIPVQSHPLEIAEGEGRNTFSFTPETPGVYTVTARAAGHAPVAGRGFTLTRVATIMVE